jgi:uncharacterized repeat protein (TIGR03803 family)
MKTFLHYCFATFIACILTATISAQAPLITGFSPTSGPVGTTVTITGTNFDPVAANNTVYFGSVKAAVLSATSTIITAQVPAATHQPISVTTNGLTGYSAKPFVVTSDRRCPNDVLDEEFPPDFSRLKPRFAVNIPKGRESGLGDFDGDGKPELITRTFDSIFLFGITNSNGAIVYTLKGAFKTGATVGKIAIGDLDGDGRLDLAAATTSSVGVLRNTSTNGTMSFATKTDVPASTLNDIAISDADGDGKPDLIVLEGSTNLRTVSVFRNTSVSGTVSFDTKKEIQSVNSYSILATTDFDGDGKSEITLGGASTFIFKNVSIPGNISFTPSISLPAGTTAIDDFDGDGKPDMIIVGNSPFKNTSTIGTIAFKAQGEVIFGTGVIGVGDLSGDGKPELISPSGYLNEENYYEYYRFTNVSNGDSIILHRYGNASSERFSYLSIADFDGDGRSDVSSGFKIYFSSLACPTNCPQLTFNEDATKVVDASCQGNDGMITVIAANGTPPIWFSKDGGASYYGGAYYSSFGSQGYTFKDLTPGTYKLKFFDYSGCESAIIEREVKRIPLPAFLNNALIVLEPSCGKADGNISIIPTSGIAPFQYSIDSGKTYIAGANEGYTFNNIAAGLYQLRLKDVNGCESGVVDKILKSGDCNGPLLYGTMQNGGTADNGVIFSFKVADGSYVSQKDFTGADGAIAWTGPVQHSNGKLYGVTASGGVEGRGVLYSFDPVTKAYTKLKDFRSTDWDGYSPGNSLLQASDNKLYGVTQQGGSGYAGVIYSFNPPTNTYTKLFDFPLYNQLEQRSGKSPFGHLIQASNGKLFGMTRYGGTYGYEYIPRYGYTSGYGVIFSFDPVSQTFAKIKDFTGDDGKYAGGSLVEAVNGKLYGMTSAGGNNNAGVIFSLDPASNAYTVVKEFSGGAEGGSPWGSLTKATDGKLYGLAYGGTGKGILFSFDPASNSYNKLYNFPEFMAQGDLMQASDGKLYGIMGGSNGAAIFSYDLVTNTFSRLRVMSAAEGNIATSYLGALIELAPSSACSPPTFLNNGLIILDATCNNNDGNINIIPTSGTAPFMYSINGGTTYVKGPDAGYGFQNLPSGTYKLRLKDANGCESQIIEREVKLNCTTTCTPPTFVNNGLIILDATCANNDGNINIIPTSGNAPFMYSINGGTTYVAAPNAGYGFQNLPSGTYKLRLKDANGCESAIVERQVKLVCNACTPPTFVNNGFIVLDASCSKSDGAINIIPTSGTAPFMYSINGGATYVAGPNVGYGFQNLPAGTYQLRLKDARGCESAIVERTVRNYYNCPGVTVSANTSEASLALSNKDVITTYPNPNSGQFKLLLQNFTSPKAEVSIYDAKGTLIQKRSLNLTQNTIADFDLKGKARGLYYLKATTDEGMRVLKVVIQ